MTSGSVEASMEEMVRADRREETPNGCRRRGNQEGLLGEGTSDQSEYQRVPLERKNQRVRRGRKRGLGVNFINGLSKRKNSHIRDRRGCGRRPKRQNYSEKGAGGSPKG